MYLVKIQGCTGLDTGQMCLLKSFPGSDLTPNVSVSLQDQQNQVFCVGKER